MLCSKKRWPQEFKKVAADLKAKRLQYQSSFENSIDLHQGPSKLENIYNKAQILQAQ
jgi:hypothetical protein